MFSTLSEINRNVSNRWGLLQAHILTQEKYQHKILGPVCINLSYVVGGVILFAAMVATGIYNAYAGLALWNAYRMVMYTLAKLAVSYSGTPNMTDMLALSPAISSLMNAAENYKT